MDLGIDCSTGHQWLVLLNLATFYTLVYNESQNFWIYNFHNYNTLERRGRALFKRKAERNIFVVS